MTLTSDTIIRPGQSITSRNTRYALTYQSDGNLVLYSRNQPMWASNTKGQPTGHCIMQSDGNLVIYGPGDNPVWDSATSGNPGSRLSVQDDGNVVIYRSDGTPIWASGTSECLKNWMDGLHDETPLSSISMVGTHDTMARDCGSIATTQDMDLISQLESGIRFLDIRTRHYGNAFPIHHGSVYLKANYTDVITKIGKFLKENPSEFIIMRQKEEYDAAENGRTYEETLNWYINENRDTREVFEKNYWKPSSEMELESNRNTSKPSDRDVKVPTAGDVRGKFIIARDFHSNAIFGPRWHGASFDIQDDYQISSYTDAAIQKKFGAIKRHFENAQESDQKKIFINHLSAIESGAGPAFKGHARNIAEGDAKRSTFWDTKGILDYTKEYLEQKKNAYTGIVVADFPSDWLIRDIIRRNKKL